jgi:hypothetical protein
VVSSLNYTDPGTLIKRFEETLPPPPRFVFLAHRRYASIFSGAYCMMIFLFNWAPNHGDVLGSGGIVPRILHLGTRFRWVVSFTPRPIYPQRKSTWYPLDRRLGGSQSRSGRGGEEKNSQSLPGFEPRIIQRIAQHYTTELSRLVIAWCVLTPWSRVLEKLGVAKLVKKLLALYKNAGLSPCSQ